MNYIIIDSTTGVKRYIKLDEVNQFYYDEKSNETCIVVNKYCVYAKGNITDKLVNKLRAVGVVMSRIESPQKNADWPEVIP